MRIYGLLAMAGLMLGMGCATTGDGPVIPSAAAGACPGDLPGVEVVLFETDHGISLIYTVDDPEAVEVLRERVHALPGLIAARQSQLGERSTPRIQSSSDDVERGAKLVVLPMLPEDRARLQNDAHHHADALATRACPDEILVR